jgi:hypothetical protein
VPYEWYVKWRTCVCVPVRPATSEVSFLLILGTWAISCSVAKREAELLV